MKTNFFSERKKQLGGEEITEGLEEREQERRP